MSLVWQVWMPLILAALLSVAGILMLRWRALMIAQTGVVARGASAVRDSFVWQYRRLISRTAPGRLLRKTLDSSAVSWEEGDVLAGLVAAWFATDYLAQRVLALHALGASIAATAAVLVGGQMMLTARRDWHGRRFNDQLPEVAWMLSNALRAGMTLQQALSLVAREVGKPARQVFQRIVDELDLARPVEEVLQGSAVAVSSQEYGLMITIICIQHRAGGDLATALEDLSHTLTDRKSVHEEVRSATAGARMAASVLPFMPLLCAVVLNLAMPGALNVLFTVWGIILLAVFCFLQWLAFITIRRMADIKV